MVKHTEGRVIVEDWIDIPLAVQTGVMFQEVRKQQIMDLLPPFPRFFCLEFWIIETREYFHYISLSISAVNF